jgi:hypothetical protein
MDRILKLLAEWKEKILFGVVLLATLPIVITAAPAALGGGIVDIDSDQRQAAIVAARIDQAQAEKVLTRLEKPGEWTPVQLDSLRIDRPFYDDAQLFKATKPTGWSLSQETYETLPPLKLSTPGYTAFHDYDMPAGPHPALRMAGGHVPRDRRPVVLTKIDAPEFD